MSFPANELGREVRTLDVCGWLSRAGESDVRVEGRDRSELPIHCLAQLRASRADEGRQLRDRIGSVGLQLARFNCALDTLCYLCCWFLHVFASGVFKVTAGQFGGRKGRVEFRPTQFCVPTLRCNVRPIAEIATDCFVAAGMRAEDRHTRGNYFANWLG